MDNMTEGWVRLAEYLVGRLFPQGVPDWVLYPIAIATVAVLLLVTLWLVLKALTDITRLWRNRLLPFFYNDVERRRRDRLRRFASFVGQRVRDDDADSRFAELEAEVEAENLRRHWLGLEILPRRRTGVRRIKSLSRELSTTRESVLLLEGRPGTGKTVTLRRVAAQMATRASVSRTVDVTIPLFVNLRGLTRPERGPIDQNLIREFVLESINPKNDSYVEEFLSKEFERGRQSGTWLFLFDSFDEIPDVLSATDADNIIGQYSDAIADFVSGMNTCRAIIASRGFWRKAQGGRPVLRILPLSDDRQKRLIRLADLRPDVEDQLFSYIAALPSDAVDAASNPMILGLLCQQARSGAALPPTLHGLFDSYMSDRFVRDRDRIAQRYDINTEDLRRSAECLAFAMAADAKINLSPGRQALAHGVERLFRMPIPADTAMDALEFIRIGEPPGRGHDPTRTFAFGHRRFQEYFATCVLLREPHRIPPMTLLTDGRWREATVALLQLQPSGATTQIVDEATTLVVGAAEQIESQAQASAPFAWPDGFLHVVSLMQDAFARRYGDMPHAFRHSAGRVLEYALHNGGLLDAKWAVEAVAVAPDTTVVTVLTSAFTGGSRVFRDIAYRQVSRLSHPTADLERNVREAVLELARSGRLFRERFATRAHLARLGGGAIHDALVSRTLGVMIVDGVCAAIPTTLFLTVAVVADEGTPASAWLRGSMMLVFASVGPLAFWLLWRDASRSSLGRVLVKGQVLYRSFVGLWVAAAGISILEFLLPLAWSFYLAVPLILLPLAVVYVLQGLGIGVTTSGPLWPFSALAVVWQEWARDNLPRRPTNRQIALATVAAVGLLAVFANRADLWQRATSVIDTAGESPALVGAGRFVLGVAMFGIALTMLIGSVRWLIRGGRRAFYWSRDWWRWRWMRRTPVDRFSASVFAGFMSGLTTSAFRSALVRLALDNQALRSDPSSPPVVAALVDEYLDDTSPAGFELRDALLMLAEDLHVSVRGSRQSADVTVAVAPGPS